MKLKFVALLAAVCTLGAGLGAAATASNDSGNDQPAISARAEVTYMAECLDDNIVKEPATFQLACADAGQLLSDLKWTGWGADEATATGTVTTTVEGKSVEQDVKVTASKLVEGEASARYTQLHVVAVGDDVEGGLTDETFELFGVDPAFAG